MTCCGTPKRLVAIISLPLVPPLPAHSDSSPMLPLSVGFYSYEKIVVSLLFRGASCIFATDCGFFHVCMVSYFRLVPRGFLLRSFGNPTKP